MPVDNQVLVGRAFLACWGATKQFGWKYTVSRLRSNLGSLVGGGGCGTDYDYISETLNGEDLQIVQKIIDMQIEIIRNAIEYYNRFDHEFKRYNTIAQVARKVGYGKGKAAQNKCIRDMDTVAAVVYGRLLPKVEKIGGTTSAMINNAIGGKNDRQD